MANNTSATDGQLGKATATPAATPAVGATTSQEFENLVFEKDLNEVYLLIDFISGNPHKNLSGSL